MQESPQGAVNKKVFSSKLLSNKNTTNSPKFLSSKASTLLLNPENSSSSHDNKKRKIFLTQSSCDLPERSGIQSRSSLFPKRKWWFRKGF